MIKTYFAPEMSGVFIIELSHDNSYNPFSRVMTCELIRLSPEINANPEIKSVVIYGGRGRAFSVGGDFNDIKKLSDEADYKEYLSEIIDSYIALLKIDCPVVAAADVFAIGQGLQVALMSDWRIGATDLKVSMPELKNGVACPLGAYILESLLGRGRMLEGVIGCGTFVGQDAVNYGVLNEVVPSSDLYQRALEVAQTYANYPSVPYATTKRIQNQRFIDGFESIRTVAETAHAESFMAKANEKHFDKVLKKT